MLQYSLWFSDSKWLKECIHTHPNEPLYKKTSIQGLRLEHAQTSLLSYKDQKNEHFICIKYTFRYYTEKECATTVLLEQRIEYAVLYNINRLSNEEWYMIAD